VSLSGSRGHSRARPTRPCGTKAAKTLSSATRFSAPFASMMEVFTAQADATAKTPPSLLLEKRGFENSPMHEDHLHARQRLAETELTCACSEPVVSGTGGGNT